MEASTSSVGFEASYAVDGTTDTYWCAGCIYGDPAEDYTDSIQVDLGAVKSFDKINMLEWPMHGTDDFRPLHQIEISIDGENWITLAENFNTATTSDIQGTANDETKNLDQFTVNLAAAARYIKITIKGTDSDGSPKGYPTMYELQVYNTKADGGTTETYTNLAAGKTMTALTSSDQYHQPELAVDGKTNTYWCANGGDETYGTNQWIQVDLGALKSFDQIKMLEYWPASATANPKHKIEISRDGRSWSQLLELDQTGTKSGITIDGFGELMWYVADKASAARYIRITIDGADTAYPTMFELEVYNTKGTADPDPLPENITEITEPLEIEVWDRKDIVLTSSVDYTAAGSTINPYSDILVDATFTHEDGTEITIPGFWNGGTEYRVRFSPTKTGTWTYLITCNKIDNLGLFQKGTVNAVANTSDTKLGQKGYIQLAEDGRYFEYADGTPFYWLGDTHWQSMNYEYISQCNYPGCDCGNQFKHIVDDRLEKGFNVYQTYFYSEGDTEKETEGKDYSFEASMWDKHSGYELYDLVNVEAFSERIDYMFDYLADNDMVIALGYGITNGTTTALTEEQFSDLTRYLTARYAAYPVVWIGGQEVDYATAGDTSFHTWLKIMDQIDDLDGYDRPMSVHMWPIYGRGWDSKDTINSQDWHEFWMLQAGHVQSGKTDVGSMTDKETYEKYWNTGKALLESEAFYEDIRNGAGAPYNGYRASRIAAWKANLCGSCGFTYGANGIWTLSYSTAGNTRDHLPLYSSEPWYMGLDKEGSYEMTYLKNFFEYVEFNTLIPRFNDTAYSNLTAEDKLVSSSADGSTYVGYFYNNGLSTGEFRGLDASKTYTASWYNPLTGKFVEIGTAEVSADGVYQLPEKPTTADWAIVVTSKALGTQETETAYTDEYVQNSTNLTSKVKTITDYHYEDSDADPWAAIDGNDDTYWNGMWTGEYWIQLEFEEKIDFNEIQMLFWPDATIDSYKLEISDDGETWTEYASGENQEPLTSTRITNGHFSIAGAYLSEYVWNKAVSAKYLKVTLNDTDGWPTIFELEIYNKTDVPTLEDGKLPNYGTAIQNVTASTVGGAIYDAAGNLTDTKANLTDGDVSTVWTPFAPHASQAIILDMQSKQELTGMIVTLPEGAYLPQYRIEGSVDGSSWTILADATLRDAQTTTVDGLKRVCESLSGEYRYVKLLWLQASSADDDKSIAEIQLFTTKQPTLPRPSIILAGALSSKFPFDDVSRSDWFYDDVRYVYEAGMMNGVAAKVFSPYGETTRGMIVTILARLDGADTTGSKPWYEAGRRWAMENGISDGTSMEAAVTREQLATILYRYAAYTGMSTYTNADRLSSFADSDKVSDWAEAAMNWAVDRGLIKGSNEQLDPQGSATRAQVAAILHRFMEQ